MSNFDEFQRVNEWDEFQEADPPVRAVLQTAIQSNPDQAAKAAQLAKRYAASEDVLLRNLQDVEMVDAVNRADEKLQTSPKLAETLRTKPWLAQQSHDDIEPLSKMESSLSKRADRTALGTLGDVGVVALKGIVGLPEAFIGLANIPTFGYAGKAAEAIGIRFEDAQAFLDTLYSPAQQQANANVAEAQGFLDTLGSMLSNPSTIATTVGESAPQMLGGAAAGRTILAAAPKIAPWLAAALGEGLMGAGSAAENTRQQEDDGLLSAKQVFAATMSGAGTALFGAVGGRAAARLGLGDIDTALVARGVDEASAATIKQGFISAIAKAGVSEGVFEELPQSVQEQMWQNWSTDKPLGEGVGKAAAQGLLAGLTMGGGFQAVSETAARVDAALVAREAANERARADAEKLQAAMAAATESKLRQRNPETFRELVDNMAQGADGAPQTVFIDAQVLNQAVQSIPAEELAQAFPGLQEQISEALAANSTVEVPVADVLTVAPGTPLEHVFLQNARMAPDALSLAEVQQSGEQAQQFIQQEAERVLQEATDQQAWAASSEAVKTTLLGQLNAAGRFTPDVNEAYATLVRDFFSVTANRLGITPEEMYQRYPLRVTGVQPGRGGAVLDQVVVQGTSDLDVGKQQAAQVFANFGGYTYDGKQLMKDGQRAGDLTLGGMFDGLNQGARGTFSPSQMLITLGESSDLSTFLHESGHFFLEVMADLASQPNAPAEIQADMDKLLGWFGVADLATWNSYELDQKRPHHERFAESIEQWLFEGKVSNPELQPIFRRFRAWLVKTYQSLADFMRGRDLKLSDEIRAVFDRMVSTDEQIRQAEEAAGLLPDFDATNAAIEKLQARSLRDLKWTVNARSKALKALQKEAASLRKGVEAEVRSEVEAQPIYRAIQWLRKGETVDPATGDQIKAEKGYRLDTAALAEMYPETALARPDLKRLKGLTAKTGLHPDIVADMFGFANGDALVRSIIDAEPIASVIEGITDQRMLERHGDLATPEAIEDAANAAVHNEARARSLATELKSQSEMLNPRQDTGRADVNGRPLTVNAITAAAKEFAANLAARRRVKDLKSAAWQHRSAEARAGKAWQAATAKGDTQAAVQAKRDQVLNNAAARALQDAQAEVRQVVEFFRRVTKGNNEKTVERGRDPDVVNAMRAILASYDVAPRLEKGALEYMDLVARNDPAMYAALKPSVDATITAAKPLQELTMEELRGLNDELRAMWQLAKRSRQMEVDGDLLDIEDAAQELVDRMTEIGIPDTIPGERGSITAREELGIKLQFAKAILSRAEQWAERMDGKFGGPFLRLVFQPIKDAADRYRTDKVSYRKRFTALLEAVAPLMPPGPVAAPELGYTFGAARDSGVAELLHAILHTGNDSNKRKLLLGRNWATENADGTLDTSRWDAFLARMHAEGKITKTHWDFAQGVWDLLEDTKPLAQETHRKVFGRYFAEVTANEVVTPFGTYRGGYVPAQTDSRMVSEAKIRELVEGENESMAYAFPAAPSGFTKARMEYNRPLLLDLRALAQHMDKVLLFSHMQGAVNDVRRLLTRKDVSYALDRIDPGAYEGLIIPWLNRAAKQIVETPIVGDRKLSRFLSKARSRAGMALMFANLSNTFQQITGFSSAAVKVRPGLMLKATGEFMTGPKALREAVAEASPFMKDRMLNENAAMNDAVEQIMLHPSMYERSQAWTQRHAYFLQSAVDNTMSPIIWTAAYNQAVEQGMAERDAIRYADGVIRQTQGSTLPEDISRFESGPAAARIFTQFIGYFNMMANTNATAMKQIVDEMGVKRGAGKLIYVALAGLLVPIWVAEAIAQLMRGGPEDEDDDGYLDDWLAAVFGMGTFKGLLATVPIVGQGAQMVVNRFNTNPADDKFSLSPAVSLIESAAGAPHSVYKAIADEGNAQKAVRDVAAAATLITGLPFYAAARPIGYAAGVAQGKVEPTSEADFARGLVTGSVSKESRVP